MGTFKVKQVNNAIIVSELSGGIDSQLISDWIDKLEEVDSASGPINCRFYDARNVTAVNLDFNNLWSFAQRRIEKYRGRDEILTAFWVSTPLNYGMCRMFQSLTEGTPLKVEVFYKLEEIVDYLNVDISLLENITY